MSPVQKPIQQRSQQTRLKIMQTALSVISQKGYHNVTVDEIANAAGVSTGIAYRYFKNKKDLLMASLAYAFENIKVFTETDDTTLSQFQSYEALLAYALDKFYEIHQKYYALHEELAGMAHTDKDVRKFYSDVENHAIDELITKCPEQIRQLSNLRERLYLAINVMENYCHIALNDDAHNFNLEFMKAETIQLVMRVFEISNLPKHR